ncbi:hypothetical protein [Rhizobium leguminosarum]
MKKWLARILGFVIAVVFCYLVAFLFFALLNGFTGQHYMPRGAGWLLAPLAAGLAGARFAESALPNLPMLLASLNQSMKYYLAGSILWMAAVLCWVFIFDPFGRQDQATGFRGPRLRTRLLLGPITLRTYGAL